MPTNSRSKGSSGGNGSVSTAGDGGSAVRPGILGGIKQNVTTRVDDQKNRAADGLGGIANVIRNAGNELRNENETIAAYVDQASEQLRRFADHIRQKGVNDMLDDVHHFARRRPALFISGAFLAGLAVARFLKSSAERDLYESDQDAAFSDVDPMTTQTAPTFGNTKFGEAGGY